MSVIANITGVARRRARRPVDSEDRQEGDRARDQGRWAEAAVSYVKHLDAHPRDFAICVQAANCLKDAGNCQDALRVYWRAIALDGTDADVFLQLGHLYKLMGQFSLSGVAYASADREPCGG